MPTDLKTLIVRHPDHALKNPRDRGLRFALYPLQMILTAKAFGVNLVDVLGPRWPCRKPPHLGLDLDATEGLIVAWRPGSHHAHRSPASSLMLSCSGATPFKAFFCFGVAATSIRS